MAKHIDSTENKKPLSKKHSPGDHTIHKENQSFLDQLMDKRYKISQHQFVLGKVQMESNSEFCTFRVFQDKDMNISSFFQKKIQLSTVDDDVMTTPSQIKHAKKQNMKDIVRRIYEKERFRIVQSKNVQEMEESLFFDSESIDEAKPFYSQQLDKKLNQSTAQTQ